MGQAFCEPEGGCLYSFSQSPYPPSSLPLSFGKEISSFVPYSYSVLLTTHVALPPKTSISSSLSCVLKASFDLLLLFPRELLTPLLVSAMETSPPYLQKAYTASALAHLLFPLYRRSEPSPCFAHSLEIKCDTSQRVLLFPLPHPFFGKTRSRFVG